MHTYTIGVPIHGIRLIFGVNFFPFLVNLLVIFVPDAMSGGSAIMKQTKSQQGAFNIPLPSLRVNCRVGTFFWSFTTGISPLGQVICKTT